MANTVKKKRQKTPLFKLILIIIFLVGVYFSYGVISEIYTTITLKKDISNVEKELRKIKDENQYLKSQKSKLEDPDYVQSYARGNYMLTKDGEEIYYLPADDKK